LEKALSNRLFESIEFNYYENLDQVYNYFKSEFPKSKYLNDISQRINPILDFKSQKIIDGIYFYPPDHGYKTIDSILSLPEFRNKVVLVDVWGSWCSSCRIEFNYLPALKERLKNEDIAYLYIADQKHHSIEKWKEVVDYHKVYGYHFLGNKDLMIDIWSYNPDCRGYYPTFMIFDKNRNLNLPCAAYPSDNELYNQLIKSINQ
jgi:thiol-disulfide isomerase/thioredoxin